MHSNKADIGLRNLTSSSWHCSGHPTLHMTAFNIVVSYMTKLSILSPHVLISGVLDYIQPMHCKLFILPLYVLSNRDLLFFHIVYCKWSVLPPLISTSIGLCYGHGVCYEAVCSASSCLIKWWFSLWPCLMLLNCQPCGCSSI